MQVEIDSISKSFPGVKALDQVTLTIRSGEVLGLIGENGAGKSTLMKILSGVYTHGNYSGKIVIDGKEMSFQSPLDAENAGIAIIHQELSSFPHLTVMENFFVGAWPIQKQTVNWAWMAEECLTWLGRVGANCHPQDLMGKLSLGQQQLVEIAKALRKNRKLIILDEPTSSLTPVETDNLMRLIRELRSTDHAIVYISHRMEEIFSICDRISILRDGQTVGHTSIKDVELGQLVEKMVGRKVSDIYPPAPERKFGQTVLETENFSATFTNRHKVGPISFSIRAGEIVGFGGLLGSGRSEIARALLGDQTVTSYDGTVRINGQDRPNDPHQAVRTGICLVSEDRKAESILPTRNLDENAGISRLACFFKGLQIDNNQEIEKSQKRLQQLGTRYASIGQKITDLSGGNQQKVIIARALETESPLVILDEPTRGIDVGAKKEIYEIIFQVAARGKAILLISSDLPELMAMSDRIFMLKNGQIMGQKKRGEYQQKELMGLAFGVNKSAI